jgi:hypothetical protein
MKKLILKSIIFSLLVGFSLFAVIYLLPVNTNISLAATIDKHRLLETTPRPRIIFAGDSNLAYGLNSAEVKKATGYNVVNMGLHGGLGLIYYMDELKPHLKKNDTVIIALDYQNYFVDGSGANTLVEITIFNPKILLSYSPKNIYNYITNIPLAFQRRLFGIFAKHTESLAYSRSAFNRYGDYEVAANVPPPKLIAPKRNMPKKINDDMVKLLNAFYDTWKGRGVHVYLTFSPLLIQDRAEQESALKLFFADMKKRVKIPVIGEPESFMYPQENFYDNLFHLNAKGKELRTKDLLAAMKKIPVLASAPDK